MAHARAQSDFEKKVIERMIAAGYRVRPQVSVGYYRIDIVAFGKDRRVAIECDGDRYHTVDKIPEDLERAMSRALLKMVGSSGSW
jgi:very-short-patch-repair endonuclease